MIFPDMGQFAKICLEFSGLGDIIYSDFSLTSGHATIFTTIASTNIFQCLLHEQFPATLQDVAQHYG